MNTSSAELRRRFLTFFQDRGHEVVPSSPLVPANDPTLLFTNAGMVQFKETFLGTEPRPYVRATSSQRCVRAGGKHNDLENVGYTARHHTFFEMLGNFSFGDYFKREAIEFAWTFLTGELKLPADKLWVTIYADDEEAARIWLDDLGVDPERFSRIGDKPGGRQYESDNFWSMGETGPCGPCSEIFYDHGPEIPGGPPGTPEEDGDRYIEIWNLVFMQFNRDAEGQLTPLPKPSVDTGMGLERLAAVMQGVHNNYDIDLFRHLVRAVADLAGIDDQANTSLRVIADHIRSCAFLITDGVVPSNEGRGYVLRRIIRRAIRHGHKLGLREAFFYRLVSALVAEMGEAYPELVKNQEHVERILRQEEERFAETLDHGMALLESVLADLSGNVVPGAMVFRLYDTYGFPVDLTADVARERGHQIDMEGFEAAMAAQRERARAASQFGATHGEGLDVDVQTAFDGYDHLTANGNVVALFSGARGVDRIAAGEEGLMVLDRTPCYAESGGQVGDRGGFRSRDALGDVLDTQKQGEAFLHRIRVTSGQLVTGVNVDVQVDQVKRRATAGNHSATHLLHAALRRLLGDHVHQKGSLVDQDRLRFDFAHFDAVKPEELRDIERMVNERIRDDLEVETRVMAQKDAVAAGAMALFGEKYGDLVRVLSMGDFSVELCGGTHVRRTGEIGLFKIVSESGVAAGVRRIEAVTGAGALAWVDGGESTLARLGAILQIGRDGIADKVDQLIERNRSLDKELERLKAKLASSQGGDLAAQAQEIDGIRILAASLEGTDAKILRDTVDQLKQKLGAAAIVLAGVSDGRVSLVAGVTKNETARLRAGDLVNHVALQVGGKGGGRPDMAQAGGKDPGNLDTALASVPAWVRTQLGL